MTTSRIGAPGAGGVERRDVHGAHSDRAATQAGATSPRLARMPADLPVTPRRRRSAPPRSSAAASIGHPALQRPPLAPGLSLKAELLQRTGSFKPRGVLTALRARRRGAGAGRHLGVRGQPRAGACLGRGAGGDRLRVVMWRTRASRSSTATRALRGGGRPRGRRIPPRAFAASRSTSPRPAACSSTRSTLRA